MRATIQRWAICTATSTLGLSRGERGLAAMHIGRVLDIVGQAASALTAAHIATEHPKGWQRAILVSPGQVADRQKGRSIRVDQTFDRTGKPQEPSHLGR
jgi:pimeloyl-ACP methyl ester carboxylesterase